MIREIRADEVEIIRSLAHKIWPITFKEILSSAQIEYMLDWMYSKEKLVQQMNAGHQFFVFELENEPIGFLGVEKKYLGTNSLRIHKIYVLPEIHGKGIGKKLIDFAEKLAVKNNCSTLNLNVNRFNNAVDFYKRLGFEVVKTEDIEIGNGYLMEDYVMEKDLRITDCRLQITD